MTPRTWLIAAGAAVALAVGGVFVWHHVAARADTAAMAQAAQHHEAAIASAAQGAAYDQQVQAQTPKIENDSAQVAALRAQLAALRARPVPPPSAPGTPDPEPVAPPVDLTAVVAKQDEVIQAQAKENGDLKVQVLNLTAARDSWRAAYDESTKEAAALRIAHEAALAAAQSNRWIGRIEGFAVGISAGYVAGKRF